MFVVGTIFALRTTSQMNIRWLDLSSPGNTRSSRLSASYCIVRMEDDGMGNSTYYCQEEWYTIILTIVYLPLKSKSPHLLELLAP